MLNKILLIFFVCITYKVYQTEAMAVGGFRIEIKIVNEGCDCTFNRTHYSIKRGDWISQPPETIQISGTAIIKAFHPVINNQTISGGFEYVCGEFVVGYEWERLPNGNRNFLTNIPRAQFEELSGGPDYKYNADVKIKSCN